MDILGEGLEQSDAFPPTVSRPEVIITGADNFLLQETVCAVEMLHHLRVQLVGNIPPIHHNDVSHPVFAVLG